MGLKETLPWRGIYPPVVTPLLEPDRLDVVGLERLIEHILSGGVSGLFLLGTTGEGPSLSQRLRTEVVREGLRFVRGRVPVLVGITDDSWVESVRLARVAAEAGAAAVVAAPPHYLPLSQTELAAWATRLADAIPLPLILYHIPALTRVGFAPATVQRLFDHPNIIGLKDSGREPAYMHAILALAGQRPDATILVGPEELLAESILLGAHGGICGGANIAPRLYVELYEAARAGDLVQCRRLHTRVIAISRSLYELTEDGSAYIRGLKCALACLGLCFDLPAEPYRPFTAAQREEIQRRLAVLDLLP